MHLRLTGQQPRVIIALGKRATIFIRDKLKKELQKCHNRAVAGIGSSPASYEAMLRSSELSVGTIAIPSFCSGSRVKLRLKQYGRYQAKDQARVWLGFDHPMWRGGPGSPPHPDVMV